MKLDEGDHLVGMAVIPPEIEDQLPESVKEPIPEPVAEKDIPPDQKESPPYLWMNP
jgi:hypothetical protein